MEILNSCLLFLILLIFLILFFIIRAFHFKSRIYLKRLARFEKRIVKLEIIHREKLLRLVGFTPISKEKQKARLKQLSKSIY